MNPHPSQTPENVGPCCICGSTFRVRTFLQLNCRAPVPGTGWGCAVCGQPSNGAVAAVCDACMKQHDKRQVPGLLKFIVDGFAPGRRRPFDPAAPVPPDHIFEHDHALHPETWRCRKCGCTQDNPCRVASGANEGSSCYWVSRDLCCACASQEQMLAFHKELSDVQKRQRMEFLRWLHGRQIPLLVASPPTSEQRSDLELEWKAARTAGKSRCDAHHGPAKRCHRPEGHAGAHLF